MSDVDLLRHSGDKEKSCDFAETIPVVIRDDETEHGGLCAGNGQDTNPEVGCSKAAPQAAEFNQSLHYCSERLEKWHFRSFWGSWLALVGIASLLLALSDKERDSDEAIATASIQRVLGPWSREKLLSDHEILQSDDSREGSTDLYDVLDKESSPYEVGALVALEAVYWLQVLSIDSTDGGFNKQVEVQRALPLALGATVVIILTRIPPATAVLLGLPLIMSLSMAVFRLWDLRSARREKRQLCASCQAAGGNMMNEEMV